MKTMEWQEATTKRLNNVNIISPELPYLFSCTIQRNIFIDYFLKKKKKKGSFCFSSSKLEAHFIDNVQEKSLRREIPSFPTPVFPEEELQS